ncbi:MAG: hypothetical protein AB7G48_11965 [Nitrospiraceae bacterium]
MMMIQRTPLLRGRSRQPIGECAGGLDTVDESIVRWSWLVLGWGAVTSVVLQGDEEAEHETE